VLDPYAGGGAIPLAAMRLGCEATTVNINPVAWFILKCTLEYPQKLTGHLRLIPEETAPAAMRYCLQRMVGDGMFIGEHPAFDASIDRLPALETAINQRHHAGVEQAMATQSQTAASLGVD